MTKLASALHKSTYFLHILVLRNYSNLFFYSTNRFHFFTSTSTSARSNLEKVLILSFQFMKGHVKLRVYYLESVNKDFHVYSKSAMDNKCATGMVLQ